MVTIWLMGSAHRKTHMQKHTTHKHKSYIINLYHSALYTHTHTPNELGALMHS